VPFLQRLQFSQVEVVRESPALIWLEVGETSFRVIDRHLAGRFVFLEMESYLWMMCWDVLAHEDRVPSPTCRFPPSFPPKPDGAC
jgi:hypothetical protein